MKIAIDVRTTAGEKTGKGWYTFHIVRNLLLNDKKNTYILYTDKKIAGLSGFKNAEFRVIESRGALWQIRAFFDLMKHPVDVFFAPTSYILPAILPKKIKTVVVIHDLVAFLFPSTHNRKAVFIEKLLLKRTLKRASRVIAVSNSTKEDILSMFKFVEKSKIAVVHNASSENFKIIPREDLQSFIDSTNLPEKFFLAVGTIIPRKNYITIIKAFAKIHVDYPKHHLLIVGKNGWDFEDVYSEIAKNHLKDYVHVLGYLSEESLIGLYNLATVLVFPSLYEGFGIPILEAMKCGCPVITANNSSLPEVAGDASILIDPKDTSALAEAMKAIAVDKELRQKLVAKGLERAKRFSWEDAGKKTAEVLVGVEY